MRVNNEETIVLAARSTELKPSTNRREEEEKAVASRVAKNARHVCA